MATEDLGSVILKNVPRFKAAKKQSAEVEDAFCFCQTYLKQCRLTVSILTINTEKIINVRHKSTEKKCEGIYTRAYSLEDLKLGRSSINLCKAHTLHS